MKNYVDKWTVNFLRLAESVSHWSKDPSTKVGCVAIGKNKQVLAQGFNGFPRYLKDTPERLEDRVTKYKYTVHAEKNCIYNACLNGVSLEGSTLYICGLPICSECAKGIIQVGVRCVVMWTPKYTYEETPETWHTSGYIGKEFLDEAGIEYIWYDAKSI